MNHQHIASSKHCSFCGGEVDGFKCPECGMTSSRHDPDHFRNCPSGGKLKLKCKKCGEAETNCAC